MSEFQEERQMEEEEEIWSRVSEGVHGAEGSFRTEGTGKAVEDDALTQERAPIYEALEALSRRCAWCRLMFRAQEGRGNPS